MLALLDVGSWLSIDAGMDSMGCCKVVSITHEHRGTPGNILVDFLLGGHCAKRIRINHGDINSMIMDSEKVKELDRRLKESDLKFNIEDKERKDLPASYKNVRLEDCC